MPVGLGAFELFIVLGLVWTAIPMGIAALVASSRGQSVGLALVVTLALGWIGLLVVVLMSPQVTATGRAIVEKAAAPPGQPGNDVAARLRSLDDLRRQELISEEEYATRRSEIISQI